LNLSNAPSNNPSTSSVLPDSCSTEGLEAFPSGGLLAATGCLTSLSELETIPSSFDWTFDGAGLSPGPILQDNFQAPFEMTKSSRQLSPFDLPACIPSSVSNRGTSRSLAPRAMAKTGAEMSALFMKRILGSYPTMMLRKETFPPFVHPLSGPEDGGILPEALVNCMSIAQMFVTRTKETTKLVWRTVRMEQERLWLEVRHRSSFFKFVFTDCFLSTRVSTNGSYWRHNKLS
jgi:hypothetical protein